MAVRYGNVKTIEMLISKNKNLVNSRNKDTLTPIFFAAKFAGREVIEVLEKHGANLSVLVCISWLAPVLILDRTLRTETSSRWPKM